MIKPIKVLCKRTEISGDNHWWDDSVSPPIRLEHDNRMLVAGGWYDVVYNENDVWDEEKRNFTFTVIDNQGHPHLHYMYEQQDMASWPEACTKYGPRDYAKWFYTPVELELLAQGKFVLDEDIHIKPGNYHWVKTKGVTLPSGSTNLYSVFDNEGTSEGNWIIAQCVSRMVHTVTDKFYWKVIGSNAERSSFDFAEIGQQVQTQEEQVQTKKDAQSTKELLDELFILTDAINKNDPDEEYPSVEYVMPFVNKAIGKYFNDTFKHLSELFQK